MTVKELIEKLEQFSESAEILMYDFGEGGIVSPNAVRDCEGAVLIDFER